jgi:hypothetical protein
MNYIAVSRDKDGEIKHDTNVQKTYVEYNFIYKSIFWDVGFHILVTFYVHQCQMSPKVYLCFCYVEEYIFVSDQVNRYRYVKS